MIRDDGDEMAGLLNARKVGGMNGQERSIWVAVEGCEVHLKLSSSDYRAGLTPSQARFIARKLYRMAHIAEQRAQS